MKKNVILCIALIICLVTVGCGGSNKGPRSGYYYKWSNGTSTPSYAKSLSVFSPVVYAEDDELTLLDAEIPPFSSWSDGGYMGSTLLIFTYYNGAEVKSICTVNPEDGNIVDYNFGGGYVVPAFVANRQGVFHVTATYEGKTLDIPIRIYHFGSVNLNYADLDNDGIRDIESLTSRFGYQIINNKYLSLVSSAPEGEYSPNAPLPELAYGRIYVIKTSSGRYCKFWPTGSNGPNSYNGMDFVSDENGNFAY